MVGMVTTLLRAAVVFGMETVDTIVGQGQTLLFTTDKIVAFIVPLVYMQPLSFERQMIKYAGISLEQSLAFIQWQYKIALFFVLNGAYTP